MSRFKTRRYSEACYGNEPHNDGQARSVLTEIEKYYLTREIPRLNWADPQEPKPCTENAKPLLVRPDTVNVDNWVAMLTELWRQLIDEIDTLQSATYKELHESAFVSTTKTGARYNSSIPFYSGGDMLRLQAKVLDVIKSSPLLNYATDNQDDVLTYDVTSQSRTTSAGWNFKVEVIFNHT